MCGYDCGGPRQSLSLPSSSGTPVSTDSRQWERGGGGDNGGVENGQRESVENGGIYT